MQSVHSLRPREIIRKRFNSHDIADLVISYWDYFHIEEPVDADEALFFYLLGGEK